MPNSRISSAVSKAGRIMVTDHGAHPPEFWAQVTAEHIAPINPDMTGQRRHAALALQAKVEEALLPHHTKVQADEGDKLKAVADHHIAAPDPEPYLDQVLADIVAASKGTEWESHFARPDVQVEIRGTVAVHFATAQHIAKSYHRDSLKGAN